MTKETQTQAIAEPFKFKNAALLNRLSEMAQVPYYATACHTLIQAEMAIVELERENATLRAEVERLAAPPAPGGDVLERRSETGMPMSANAPEKCPITRRPFFMVISHPELGWVPTYGGPYDSYTIPHMEGKPNEPYHERELTCHHYDHDYGGWVDDESIPMRVINEGVLNALQSTQGQTARQTYKPGNAKICANCGQPEEDHYRHGSDCPDMRGVEHPTQERSK